VLRCSVPRRTFQRRVEPGGGAETFRAVLSSAELSRAKRAALDREQPGRYTGCEIQDAYYT